MPDAHSAPHRIPLPAPLCLILPLLLATASSLALWTPRPAEAGEVEAVREATETLEGEIKLASRPQIYLILDLTERVLLIKGRGVELHRLPIHGWRLSRRAGEGPVRGLFRLRARPQVDRPKLEPGKDPTLEPVALDDMPGEYDLVFDPPLTIFVGPPAREQPWLWGRSRWREWRTRLASWLGFVPAQDRSAPLLRLTLSSEAARSLAWSVTDGMPLLIGRTTVPFP